jgi:hypothetical protein
MGLLSRVLKTPDDDTDEVQDEFQAEESGLLMASAPASEKEADTPPEAGVDAPPEAAAEMPAEAEDVAPTAEGGAESPSQQGDPSQQGEGESPEAADNPEASEPPAESQAPPSQPAENSDEDPLAAFRSTLGQHQYTQGIQDDLVEVPMAELLAEARSIRDALAGASQGSQLPGEAEDEAA